MLNCRLTQDPSIVYQWPQGVKKPSPITPTRFENLSISGAWVVWGDLVNAWVARASAMMKRACFSNQHSL